MESTTSNKLLKYALILFIFLALPFTCALRWGNIGDKGARLYFSCQPIQKDNLMVGRNFLAKEKVYYMLINPKGFRDDHIRVQIIKKDDKTSDWGYKIYWSKDYRIDPSQKEFSSYFVIHEPGYYFMQIFSFDDFDRVVARNDFWIK